MIRALVFLLLLFSPQAAFWCPMHVDVRTSTAGRCPVCGMELVPIAPRRLGEYRLEVEVRGAGMTLRVTDPDGQPPASFAIVHERPFHLFIVSRSLEYFAHVHPQPAGGAAFELRQPLPPGEYMLIADFQPVEGAPQMLQRAIVTPGYRGRLFAAPPALAPGPPEQTVDGLRIRLDAQNAAPRREAALRFSVTDAASGTAVTDLEPYLGARGHLLLVRSDLSDAIHAHPEEPDGGVGTITFKPLMPAPGDYKLWVQVQRRGRVITAPFVVRVPD